MTVTDAAWKRRRGYGCKAACRCAVTVGRLKQCTGCCCEFSTVTLGSKSHFHSFIQTLLFTQSLTLWPAVLHRLSDSPLSISCLSSATIYVLSGEGLIRRPQQASHPPHQTLCPQTHCSTSPSCDCAQKPQPASTSRLNSVPCIRQPIRCFKGY